MNGLSSVGPLVSIGLPTYNRPEFMANALNSLAKQTYHNIEIIISDNASSNPRVKEIGLNMCKQDSRISYFRQDQNIGFVRNFEFVYNNSNGEYFMWAADDDDWHPDFIQSCMAPLLDRSKNIVLSFCHVKKKDPVTGKIICEKYADPVACIDSSFYKRSLKYIYNSGGNHCFYGIYKKNIITHWFFEQRFGSDHIAILSILKIGSIFISDKVLFTSSVGGSGFEREAFHRYYEGKIMKVCVNLSSTITWFYEFLRYIFLYNKYTLRERFVLCLFVMIRFLRPRYWKRFMGDLYALVFRPGIWKFKVVA